MTGPADKVDLVIVPGGAMYGLWIHSGQRLTRRAEQRLMEIIAGHERVVQHARWGDPQENTIVLANYGVVKLASEEEWARAIGLVIVGLAERVNT